MTEPHELRYHVTLTYHARPGQWPGRYSCCARGPIHAARRIRSSFPETRALRLASIHVEPGASPYFGTDR